MELLWRRPATSRGPHAPKGNGCGGGHSKSNVKSLRFHWGAACEASRKHSHRSKQHLRASDAPGEDSTPWIWCVCRFCAAAPAAISSATASSLRGLHEASIDLHRTLNAQQMLMECISVLGSSRQRTTLGKSRAGPAAAAPG